MNNRRDPISNVVIILVFSAFLLSCHRSKPQSTTKYAFTGKVIAVDMQSKTADIDGDMVQGYMEAMTMSYNIRPESMLSQLSPGDRIAADLIVVNTDPRDDNAVEQYWLENVKVTRHGQPPAAAPNAMHMPSAGEDVPDFVLTNQDGKRISLHDYRGKTLFITFIYTRCPFPDFCPRMSSNFNEIYKQLGTNPALTNAQLLSVSFDPAHDTPRVLRDYGFRVAQSHDATLFRRWQFAAPKSAELQKMADFFALTVKPEGGMITHNLSTSVIGPEGKIVKWYHGSDWQVSDLIKDVADTGSPKS